MAARGDPPATVGGMEELAGRGPRLTPAEGPTGLVAVARPPVPGAERRAVGLLRSGQRRAVVDPGVTLTLGQPEPGADDVAGGHEDPVAGAELEPGDRSAFQQPPRRYEPEPGGRGRRAVDPELRHRS